MLAGVAASGDQTPPSRGKRLLNAAMDDGTATPPPFEEEVAMGTSIGRKQIPALPIAVNTGRKPLGLSLQIVNPDSLGVSYDQQQKRRRDGQGSPQTPWDGQLQALVRYVLNWKTLCKIMSAIALTLSDHEVRRKRRALSTRWICRIFPEHQRLVDSVLRRVRTQFVGRDRHLRETRSTKLYARWTLQQSRLKSSLVLASSSTDVIRPAMLPCTLRALCA
jgi:hypothetical protein